MPLCSFIVSFTAFGLAMIWITTGMATYIANQVNGRKKRDLAGAFFGDNPNITNSLSCIAKFMCELQQQEELFGYLPRYLNIFTDPEITTDYND